MHASEQISNNEIVNFNKQNWKVVLQFIDIRERRSQKVLQICIYRSKKCDFLRDDQVFYTKSKKTGEFFILNCALPSLYLSKGIIFLRYNVLKYQYYKKCGVKWGKFDHME